MGSAKIKKSYGHRFPFWGTMRTQTSMAFAAPKEVKKEVWKAIKIAAPNYFVGVSGNIYEGIPVDNVKAMLEAIYEFK